MKIATLSPFRVRAYLDRSLFVFKAMKLAGPKWDQPVFRQCAYCKVWQFYDDKNGTVWFFDLEKERKYIRSIVKAQVPDYFPAVSHGACPSCAEKEMAKI